MVAGDSSKTTVAAPSTPILPARVNAVPGPRDERVIAAAKDWNATPCLGWPAIEPSEAAALLGSD